MGCGVSSQEQTSQPVKSTRGSARYVRGQMIGKGTYGQVYRCVDTSTNRHYAMKVVKINAKTAKEARREIESLKNQISMLKKLNHPNIVRYYSFELTPDLGEVEIVLELVESGTLKQQIDQNGPLSEGETSRVCKSILKALSYLHQQNIIHRDLKCANILVCHDMTPKLTDFGTAKIVADKDTDDIAKLSASLKGTPFYMAPEVLKRTGHDQSADIWSFGCMVIEMLSGKAPWTTLNARFAQIINYISSGVKPPFPNNISKQCYRFLENCLDAIPTRRLRAEELLRHKFIDKNHYKSIDKNHHKYTDRGHQELALHVKKNESKLPRSKRKNTSLNDLGADLSTEQLDEGLAGWPRRGETRKNCTTGMISADLLPPSSHQEIKAEKVHRRFSSKRPQQRNRKYLKEVERLQRLQDQISEVSISEEEMGRDYYVVEKALTDLKKGRTNAKTSVTMKNTTENILSMSNSENNGNSIMQLRENTDMTHEEDAIDTAIARAERNRFLEQHKKLSQQRVDQQRKWEEELREGAEFLKKEFSSRYLLPLR